MATVIYIDVLITVNLLINYFLLMVTAFFTSENKRRGRIAVSAIAGSAFSLMILVPFESALLSAAVKLIGAAVMAGIAFGFKEKKRLIRNSVYLFISSYLFAGLIYSVKEITGSRAVIVNNHTVYIGTSPVFLILTVLVLYVILSAAELLFKRPKQISKTVKLMLTGQKGTVEIRALIDSGNKLRDAVSGKSVVVLKRSLAERLVDEKTAAVSDSFGKGNYDARMLKDAGRFAIIPFSTINGEGMLLGFFAKNATVYASGRRCILDRPLFAFTDDSHISGADGILSYDSLFTE